MFHDVNLKRMAEVLKNGIVISFFRKFLLQFINQFPPFPKGKNLKGMGILVGAGSVEFPSRGLNGRKNGVSRGEGNKNFCEGDNRSVHS